MPKDSDKADSPEVDPNLTTVPEPTVDESKAKEKELKDAQATDDPNDDIEAARPDEGTEVDIPADPAEAEPEEKPDVSVEANPNFQIPVFEEWTDDQGNTRGRIKGYETPADVKVYSAVAHALGESDDDGYVKIPGTYSAAVASDIKGSPAVEVAE